MPRGQKTEQEVIYQVMASWAIHKNKSEVSRETGVAYSTVKNIIDKNQEEEEFVKLGEEKKKAFSKKAIEAMGLAFERLIAVLGDPNAKIPVNHLMVVIGTLYDKLALLEGSATENIQIIGSEKLTKLAELAGYEKRE